MLGCPSQELAPLGPCTVSGVSLEVPQSGVDKVDLLFMIDNSGSMAEEQKKLAAVLPGLVTVLTTGFRQPPTMPGQKPDFPPVKSLHIGVVSSDMGVNLAPAADSCGAASFNPVAPDPSNPAVRTNPPINGERISTKVFGDDGQMNISTAVAVAGISARPPETPFTTPVSVVVPPDPSCGTGPQLNPGQRFIDFTAGVSDANAVAKQFGCIAKLGKNGCGLEQQLESALKAVTPSTSTVTPFFSRGTKGHGDNDNRGFLREDAILAVILVTDEEDCSIPDESSELFNAGSKTFTEDINIRCGLDKYQGNLHPVERYINGFKSLKPAAYANERIIFAGIVGIPLNPQKPTFSGKDELDALLALEAMKFVPENIPNSMNLRPRPACASVSDGTASPARRMVQVAKGFNENGVVTSICADEYASALKVIIQKIADQLTGACLPRKLSPNAEGKVECDVVEIKADLTDCDPGKGRVERLPNRTVNGTQRTVCRIDQVPVMNKQTQAGKTGWYYDDFSAEVTNECKTDPQRIAFTPGAEPSPGSQAKFECFQPVSGANADSTGIDAVNLGCNPENGDDVCTSKGLICIAGKTCQVPCGNDSNCPESWLCAGDAGGQRKFCINPTCPQSATEVQ